MYWCIYRITNLINGKTYIGQHKYKKLNDDYMGSGKLIKRAIKKHGIENFKKEIIYSRIQYRETADDMERFAIAKERAIGKAEYNLANGGEGISGYKHSEETKKKMSEAHKNMSEETKRKMSEALKGRTPWNKGKSYKRIPCPEETKNKISKTLMGHNVSEKTKEKLSKKYKGKHWKLIDGKRVWY